METEKQYEILEGNKLIADFIGFKYDRSFPGHGGTILITFSIENCLFHNSWDWLFPVIEKIGAMPFNDSQNRFSPTVERFMENDKESIWKQVVEFIRWYNAKQ